MSIPRQLPWPAPPRPFTVEALGAYILDLGSRLRNWIQSVSDYAAAQILWQVQLEPAADGAQTVFTCPYKLSRAADGTPQALVVAGTTIVPSSTATTPAAGEWVLVDTATQQQLVFGTPPATGPLFCAFLVAAQM